MQPIRPDLPPAQPLGEKEEKGCCGYAVYAFIALLIIGALGSCIGGTEDKDKQTDTGDGTQAAVIILIEVLGTIAEQERLTIHQRQREGINAAKAKGKHLGRPSTSLPDNWEEVLALWQSGEITARRPCGELGMNGPLFISLSVNQAEITHRCRYASVRGSIIYALLFSSSPPPARRISPHWRI